MDPSLGRFTSWDQHPAPNHYVYCNNSPQSATDQSGRFSLPDQAALVEGLGVEASEAQGALQFLSWFGSRLSQALGRHNIKLVIEFVEDGTIEAGMGHGRFIAQLSQLTIQLEKSYASPRLLCHELAEAMMWYTGASGFVSDNEAALYRMLQGFLR